MNRSSLRIAIMCAAVLLFSQQTGEATLSFAEEPAVFAAVAPVYGLSLEPLMLAVRFLSN
jgi:hypothetical protein